jgi:hypothetical protein
MPQQRVLVVYEKASESQNDQHETWIPPKADPPLSTGRAKQVKRGLDPTVGCKIISVEPEDVPDSEPE